MKKIYCIIIGMLLLICTTPILLGSETNEPINTWNMSGFYTDLLIEGDSPIIRCNIWIPVGADALIQGLQLRLEDGTITNTRTDESYSGEMAVTIFLFKGNIIGDTDFYLNGTVLSFQAGGIEE